MSHETRINEALRALGEEFRMGMVGAEEYRARRRVLIGSWGERDVTTSPRSLRSAPAPATAQMPVQRDPRAAPLPAPARRWGAVPAIATGVALIAAAAAGYGVWQRQHAPALPTMADAPVAAAPEIAAIREAADAFVARNDWDPQALDEFLARWRSVPAALRAEARATPALRTLRHALQQNIEAESQLVAPDATADQRQRLDALTHFAQELDA